MRKSAKSPPQGATGVAHSAWTRFRAGVSGEMAVEYALLAALIGVVLIGGVAALGDTLNDGFNAIAKAATDES